MGPHAIDPCLLSRQIPVDFCGVLLKVLAEVISSPLNRVLHLVREHFQCTHCDGLGRRIVHIVVALCEVRNNRLYICLDPKGTRFEERFAIKRAARVDIFPGLHVIKCIDNDGLAGGGVGVLWVVRSGVWRVEKVERRAMDYWGVG